MVRFRVRVRFRVMFRVRVKVNDFQNNIWRHLLNILNASHSRGTAIFSYPQVYQNFNKMYKIISPSTEYLERYHSRYIAIVPKLLTAEIRSTSRRV